MYVKQCQYEDGESGQHVVQRSQLALKDYHQRTTNGISWKNIVPLFDELVNMFVNMSQQ